MEGKCIVFLPLYDYILLVLVYFLKFPSNKCKFVVVKQHMNSSSSMNTWASGSFPFFRRRFISITPPPPHSVRHTCGLCADGVQTSPCSRRRRVAEVGVQIPLDLNNQISGISKNNGFLTCPRPFTLSFWGHGALNLNPAYFRAFGSLPPQVNPTSCSLP